MIKSILENNFSKYISIFILFILSKIFFSNISFYFFFLLLFLTLLSSLREINIFSRKLYNVFLLIFFTKIILLFIVFWIGEGLGLEYGNISGSDSMTYYFSSYLIKQIILNMNFHGLLISFQSIKDISYVLYLSILQILVEDISLVQIGIVNIFLTSFSVIFVFRILTIFEVSKKIIFIMSLLILIDLKILVFSFFNLEETLTIFLITVGIYDFLKFKKNFSLMLAIKILLTFFYLSLLKFDLTLILILILFFYIFFDNLKSKINLKTFFYIVLISIPLIFFILYILFFENYQALMASRMVTHTDSIGGTIHDLDILANPINIFLKLFAGIIGIFPVYKIFTPFMELEKLGVIWFHLLLIFFSLGLMSMIFRKDFNNNHFFLLLIIIGLLFIFAVASGGSLVFIRYSIFLHIPLMYFSAYCLISNTYKKIFYGFSILLIFHLFLIGIYIPIKSIYF